MSSNLFCRFILGASLALTLTACATTPGGGPVLPFPSNISVDDVRNMAASICRFVPTAQTVVSLLTANPAWSTVADAAVAICNAVTKQSARRGTKRGGPAYIGRVPIRGRFV